MRGGAVRRGRSDSKPAAQRSRSESEYAAPGECEADRHPDVCHRAHRNRHGRDAEVPDREVAVGDPDPVAPRGDRGLLVHVGIGRPDVGDGGEHHRVEPELRHPLLEVDAPRALETLESGADELGEQAAERVGHAVGAGARDVLRDVEVERSVPVGKRALGMREDLRSVDLGERREPRLPVRGQEVVPRPHRHVPDLGVEVVGRHDPAIEDRRRSGPVGLVVADHGEVHDDDLCAGRLEVGLRLRPEGEHRRPRLDALTGGRADAPARFRHPDPRRGTSRECRNVFRRERMPRLRPAPGTSRGARRRREESAPRAACARSRPGCRRRRRP